MQHSMMTDMGLPTRQKAEAGGQPLPWLDRERQRTHIARLLASGSRENWVLVRARGFGLAVPDGDGPWEGLEQTLPLGGAAALPTSGNSDQAAQGPLSADDPRSLADALESLTRSATGQSTLHVEASILARAARTLRSLLEERSIQLGCDNVSPLTTP